MTPANRQSPRLAWPFSVIAEGERVWLIAGEDVRFCLDVGAHAAWIADFIAQLDGSQTRQERLAALEGTRRSEAASLLDALYGERLLVDGPAEARHEPHADVAVFHQDSLDYAALLRANRDHLESRRRWIWVTSGPLARGYVSPLFLPDAGPCAACLLTHFQKVSPVPEVYDLLLTTEQPPRSSPMPDAATGLLGAVLACKLEAAAQAQAVPALYQLHVVEAGKFEVTAHEVLVDPECTVCNRYRGSHPR